MTQSALLIRINFIYLFLFLFLFLFSTENLRADQVAQVKGQKALLEFDQTTTTPGEEFYTLDGEGKRKAILRITQVKGKKALAEILRGKPEAGHSLSPKVAPSQPSSLTSNTPDKSARKKKRKSLDPTHEQSEETTYFAASPSAPSWGGLANFYMNSMTAKTIVTGPREVTVNLQGNSFGIGGFYDYRWSPHLGIRGIGAFDQYQLSGTTPFNDCDNTTNCSVSINYLSGYGIARYDFKQGETKFWAGGGFGYLFALSKSSSILDTNQISTNLVYVLSVGGDIQMGGKSFIPLQFDYAIFQGSSSVKSNSMILRAGYGFYF